MKRCKTKDEKEQTSTVLDLQGCNRLAKCIVGKAVDDWISLSTGKYLPSAGVNFSELKRFFRSDFFAAIYPNISGKEAIEKLEAKYPSRYPDGRR